MPSTYFSDGIEFRCDITNNRIDYGLSRLTVYVYLIATLRTDCPYFLFGFY